MTVPSEVEAAAFRPTDVYPLQCGKSLVLSPQHYKASLFQASSVLIIK